MACGLAALILPGVPKRRTLFGLPPGAGEFGDEVMDHFTIPLELYWDSWPNGFCGELLAPKAGK